VIKLYTAADPMQAHLLRGALEAVGIEAEVRRDTLFSTRGETPVTFDTLPEVWIPDDADLELARRLVAELETKDPAPAGPMWTCASCGEQVVAQFDRCWNCGGVRN
jgi:hypothetical protein